MRFLHSRQELSARVSVGRQTLRGVAGRSNTSRVESLVQLSRIVNPLSTAKLVLVAGGRRTGSTLLCSRAAQQPGIGSEYELLNPVAFPQIERHGLQAVADYIRGITSAYNICVVKIFPEHLENLDISWSDISQEFPDALWLHLYRADCLAQYASLVRAEASGEWIARSENQGRSKVQPIEINVDDYRDYRDNVAAADQTAFAAVGSSPNYTRVSYEEITDKRSSWVADVLCPLLDVTPVALTTDEFVKQGSTDSDLGIANMAELRTKLTNGERQHPFASPQDEHAQEAIE